MDLKHVLVIVGLILCLNVLQSSCRVKNSQALTLAERVQQLSDLAHTRAIIKLNGPRFKEYVKATPRNYSVIVLFTAMAAQRQCHICRHANDEFVIIANSYRLSQAQSNKLFFASVDFDEGSDVFQMMRLNTAPVYMHFPPKGKPKPADTMDIQRVGFTAEAIAKWIAERTDIQIQVLRPPNYFGTAVIIMLGIVIGGLLFVRRNKLEFINNKTVWGMGAVFFTLAMISGQMWNHIKGPLFIHYSSSGHTTYIYASSQGQFIFETYIVMVLNGAVVLGMILMTESASRKGDVKKRQIFATIGGALVTVFFSILLYIFRSKAQGYPYSLLFR